MTVELLRRIVMESATLLQTYDSNYSLPTHKQVLTCSSEWFDLYEELRRASKLALELSEAMAKNER